MRSKYVNTFTGFLLATLCFGMVVHQSSAQISNETTNVCQPAIRTPVVHGEARALADQLIVLHTSMKEEELYTVLAELSLDDYGDHFGAFLQDFLTVLEVLEAKRNGKSKLAFLIKLKK